MRTENVPALKIHRLSQEQYNNAFTQDRLEENAIYLTPEVVQDVLINKKENITELTFLNFGGVSNTKTVQIGKEDVIEKTNTITDISIKEQADGSVVFTNIMADGSEEQIIIRSNEEGNPSALSYNGVEIPIHFEVE